MRRLIAVPVLLWLAGCGSTPAGRPDAPARGDAVAESPASPQVAAFEARQRERAQQATKQGHLADAATAWELLALLRPDVDEYRARLADTKAQIAVAVADRLQRAALAQRRGDADVASLQYLAVLALQPDNAPAAEALRAIERERIRRNFLGKYSRITLTRRAGADAQVVETAAEGSPRVASRERQAEFEHASALANQGEFKDAIRLLERLGTPDAATSRALANVYYKQALSLSKTSRPAAADSAEQAVRLDGKNARARALLAELRKPATASPAASSATTMR